MFDKGNYYTIKQVADMCGLTKAAIHLRINQGKIKAEKIGGWLNVITAEEVERMRREGELKNQWPIKQPK